MKSMTILLRRELEHAAAAVVAVVNNKDPHRPELQDAADYFGIVVASRAF